MAAMDVRMLSRENQGYISASSNIDVSSGASSCIRPKPNCINASMRSFQHHDSTNISSPRFSFLLLHNFAIYQVPGPYRVVTLETKRICSPVTGCSKPKTLACNACLGKMVKQFSTNCLYLLNMVPFEYLISPYLESLNSVWPLYFICTLI